MNRHGMCYTDDFVKTDEMAMNIDDAEHSLRI